MTGTLKGGKKAGKTTKQRYGNDFYQKIGAKGGAKSRGGGFTYNPELASIAGKKGGQVSKRGKGNG